MEQQRTRDIGTFQAEGEERNETLQSHKVFCAVTNTYVSGTLLFSSSVCTSVTLTVRVRKSRAAEKLYLVSGLLAQSHSVRSENL